MLDKGDLKFLSPTTYIRIDIKPFTVFNLNRIIVINNYIKIKSSKCEA